VYLTYKPYLQDRRQKPGEEEEEEEEMNE